MHFSFLLQPHRYSDRCARPRSCKESEWKISSQIPEHPLLHRSKRIVNSPTASRHRMPRRVLLLYIKISGRWRWLPAASQGRSVDILQPAWSVNLKEWDLHNPASIERFIHTDMRYAARNCLHLHMCTDSAVSPRSSLRKLPYIFKSSTAVWTSLTTEHTDNDDHWNSMEKEVCHNNVVLHEKVWPEVLCLPAGKQKVLSSVKWKPGFFGVPFRFREHWNCNKINGNMNVWGLKMGFWRHEAEIPIV